MDAETIRHSGTLAAETLAERAGRERSVRIGSKFGRYEILERVGMGAMGVVYAAWDPRIERKVALKLLWPGSEARRVAMLTREAQAMARLSDPNVVQIFDVGTDHGQVWIAMEFVQGCSLDVWLSHASRTWREVFDVYAAAGRGLAAAHRCGVVHRDFKPSNVMLSCADLDFEPERVLVADFGLARAPQDDWTSGRTEASGVADIDLDESFHPVSQTGTIAGTPAYMAPEQHDGRHVDAEADQFAFCVALFEGLYGHRPFLGKSVASLLADKFTARIADPPPSSPALFLLPILKRGLAVAPTDRYESMDELLDAMQRAVRRRQAGWRWGGIGVGLLGCAAAAGLAWAGLGAGPCEQGANKVATVWNGERAASIEAAFDGTELVYAPATWDKVRPDLDRYAEDWASAYGDACSAVGFEPEAPPSAPDAMLQCLDRHLAHLDALLALFGQGEPATVERAVAAIAELPSSQRCRAEAMAEVAPPRPGQVEQVEKLRAKLAEAAAMLDAGRYAEGRRKAKALLSQVEELDYAPLTAEVLLTLGRFASEDGDAEAALRHFDRAVWIAEEAGLDRIVVQSAIGLVGQVSLQGNHDDALKWIRHAEAALERMGDAPELRADLLGAESVVRREVGHYDRARELLEQSRSLLAGPQVGPQYAALENTLGNVAFSQGRYNEAIGHQQRALELYREVLGPDHPSLAAALNSLGMSYQMKGDFEEARAAHEEGLELRERALGSEHPDVAESLTNLGALAWEERNVEEAREHYERALEIKEVTFGTDHVRIAAVLQNLGAVELSQGDSRAALARFSRSLAIVEAAYGTQHPQVASTLSNIGVTLSRTGDYAGAAKQYRRALAIENEVLGPTHPGVAVTRQNLGHVLFELGNPEEAAEHHEAALESFLEVVGPNHGNTTQARIGLAKALAATGETDRAVELLRAARRDYKDSRSVLIGDLAFELAKIIHASRPGERDQALALAKEAKQHYETLGDRADAETARVDAWLADVHRGSRPASKVQ